MNDADDLDARARLRVGTFLRGDKYRLDRLLGLGAMGAVFAATHRNGSRVAVKLLHPELSRVQDVRRRFLREGYIANRVEHRGLVRIIDDDVDNDGSTFLVMELLEGRTLADEWEESGRRMAVSRVGGLTVALLDVLSAVHAEGIVHRDVKPENVFLTRDGAVKLLDLGIARLIESRSLTASGTMMGTPEFVAPEQAGGDVRQIDGRTDLYSVGAMMFALLTGRFVHDGRTSMEKVVYAATKQAQSLFDAWPDAPGGLANVVDVALRFSKHERWASAHEMRLALVRTLGSMGLVDSGEVVGSTVPAPATQPSHGPTGTLLRQPGEPEPESAIPLRRPARKD